MRPRPLRSLLLTCVLATACAPESTPAPEPTPDPAPPSGPCAGVVLPGVRMTVVNADGTPAQDAHVTYSLEGGAPVEAVCDPPSPRPTCDTWRTDFEQPGHYVLLATSADGARSARAEAQVERGPCNVITQQVTLTLSAVP